MKQGDIVYRKAPYRVASIGDEKDKEGKVLRTHISLIPVETQQFINCLTTDVEEVVPEAAIQSPSETTGTPVEGTSPAVPEAA